MMLERNSQVILAYALGLALIFLLVASYLAIWHPRVPKKYWVTEKSTWRQALGSIPWILVFSYIGLALVTVFTLAYYSANRPNW